MSSTNTYTAFDHQQMLFQGPLHEVVIKVKKKLGKSANSNILIFSDSTGQSMDFNFHGTEADVLKRLEVFTSEKDSIQNTGPGRPKLGVISREVSLLPRHWEWLAGQSSGTSAAIRSLVEEAIKKTSNVSEVRQAQDRTYKFMSVLAGDLTGYEEALRALYKKDQKKFQSLVAEWPEDIQTHCLHLAKPIFTKKD